MVVESALCLPLPPMAPSIHTDVLACPAGTKLLGICLSIRTGNVEMSQVFLTPNLAQNARGCFLSTNPGSTSLQCCRSLCDRSRPWSTVDCRSTLSDLSDWQDFGGHGGGGHQESQYVVRLVDKYDAAAARVHAVQLDRDLGTGSPEE